MVYPVANLIVPPILRIWIKSIEGMENIPEDGAFVICPNHSSFYDDLLLHMIVCPRINKHVHMYVNRKYFNHFFLRKFLEWGRCIPVEVYDSPDKRKINEKAFKQALVYLKKKEPIGIYPEGHRSRDGELQKAKFGAATLALTAKVPVLPVGIIGSAEVLPKGKSFPRLQKVVKIKVGKPINLDKYSLKDKEKVTRTIMNEIAKLTHKKYRY
jgi:1-acyl-sn-glycerol-3-phosphate acyltransferase